MRASEIDRDLGRKFGASRIWKLESFLMLRQHPTSITGQKNLAPRGRVRGPKMLDPLTLLLL
jgi:hypothetical protein